MAEHFTIDNTVSVYHCKKEEDADEHVEAKANPVLLKGCTNHTEDFQHANEPGTRGQTASTTALFI